MEKFTLGIELGNEAMQTPEHMAEALRRAGDIQTRGILRTAIEKIVSGEDL